MSKTKKILIVGAKSDIALAVANKYASEGYELQLAARNSSELDPVVDDLKIRHETNVIAYELDILKYERFPDFLDSLACLPDVVLCAVGLLGRQNDDQQKFLNSVLVMRTNYEGPSLLLGEIARRFEMRGHGSIIGISSVAGDRGRASNYIYGSAKSGFTAFLSGLRNRVYKSGVNILTVLPGFVATKMTQSKNLPSILTAQPEEVADKIFAAVKTKKNIIYVRPVWRYIMLVICSIPEFIFKRMSF